MKRDRCGTEFALALPSMLDSPVLSPSVVPRLPKLASCQPTFGSLASVRLLFGTVWSLASQDINSHAVYSLFQFLFRASTATEVGPLPTYVWFLGLGPLSVWYGVVLASQDGPFQFPRFHGYPSWPSDNPLLVPRPRSVFRLVRRRFWRPKTGRFSSRASTATQAGLPTTHFWFLGLGPFSVWYGTVRFLAS